MYQEVKDIAYELSVRTIPSQIIAKWSEIDWTQWFTIILLFLQIVYLLRKWWIEETEVGKKLRKALGENSEHLPEKQD